ncbi:hypothetical protein [Bifidobacterium crudilactis]|jgi:FlaA1/EpsC-like NDP-sugar epimerase|uniref:hypothetical protein n=1 Tax=Bifidobacterium crudilactis TaxID=327277 RepID=UPI002F358172|nr:hypothetical protein [Bifidobacterium crudilactis]
MVGIFKRSVARTHSYAVLGLAVMLVVVLCTALSSCSPTGSAVGDTQTRLTSQEHDGTDRADIRVLIIGADSAGSNQGSELISELNASHITAVYSSAQKVHDGVALAVRDAVEARPSVIVMYAGQRRIGSDPSLDKALRQARMAGVPVAIFSEGPIGVDKTLYAARLAPAASEDCLGRATDVESVASAVQQLVDDVPHPALMCLGAEPSE